MKPNIGVSALNIGKPTASTRMTYTLFAGAIGLFVFHGVVVEVSRTPANTGSAREKIADSGQSASRSRPPYTSPSSQAGQSDQPAVWQNSVAILGAAVKAERNRQQQMLRQTTVPPAYRHWSYSGQQQIGMEQARRARGSVASGSSYRPEERSVYPTEPSSSPRMSAADAAALSSVRPHSYYGQAQSPWGLSNANELQRSSGYSGYSGFSQPAPLSPSLGSAQGYDYYTGSGFAGSSRPNHIGGHDFHGPSGYMGSSSPNYLGGQEFYGPSGHSGSSGPNYIGGQDFYGPSGYMGNSRPNYIGGQESRGIDGSSMSSDPNR